MRPDKLYLLLSLVLIVNRVSPCTAQGSMVSLQAPILRPFNSLEAIVKKITLSQGKFALVDDEDYDWLMQWKWSTLRVKTTFYATRCTSRKEGRRRWLLMHREILIKYGVLSKNRQTDHVDRNGLNNQKENLRCCTTAENNMNRIGCWGTTSRYKGVYYDKYRKKWDAAIMLKKKRYSLGSWITEKEAALAYDIGAVHYFGKFAKLNFPQLIKG